MDRNLALFDQRDDGFEAVLVWHTEGGLDIEAKLRQPYDVKANGEDVKVVQELLRHGSSRGTLDIYAQAQMPAKRAAQQKVVAMVRKPTTDVTAQPALNCPQNAPQKDWSRSAKLLN